MTHITGLAVIIGPFIRQRCAWCGQIIQDDDASKMASIDGQAPGSFAADVLVRVQKTEHGSMTTLLDGKDLPEDSCFYHEQKMNAKLEVNRG